MFKQTVINFPPQFDCICISNKDKSKSFFYCYNKIFFYKFSPKIFFLNENFNSFIFLRKTNVTNNIFEKNFFKKFLKSLDCYFFLKIKFKGKGYKIKYSKKRKIIRYYFNRSHRTMIRYRGVLIKKNMKYKFILKSPNLEYLNKVGQLTVSVRPLNIFTNRGLRISRTYVGKRKGKKGSYI